MLLSKWMKQWLSGRRMIGSRRQFHLFTLKLQKYLKYWGERLRSPLKCSASLSDSLSGLHLTGHGVWRWPAPSLFVSSATSHCWSCYHRPFRVGPQWGSSCPVLFEPRDQIWFRSRGKLYSLIREWTGARSGSREGALQERTRWGCFAGFCKQGGGQSSRETGTGVRRTAHAPDRGLDPETLHAARHRHRLQLRVTRCASARSPELRRQRSRFTLGTQVWRAGSEASARSTPWASDPRLSTKEKTKRLDFILLPRLGSAGYKSFLSFVLLLILEGR